MVNHMTEHQDILNLIEELKQAKQQLDQAAEERERQVLVYKQAHDAYDSADRSYTHLLTVFEYCVAHDCDPAYAKIMLSDKQQRKSETQTLTRGSKLMSLPMAEAGMPNPRASKSRTLKQKMVDWMMKS